MDSKYRLPLLAFLLTGFFPVSAQDKWLQAKINGAVQGGVGNLKKNAAFPPANLSPSLGHQAILGWALLESGVPITDPSVQKLAQDVREKIPAQCQTYFYALALIFLERLGQADDFPLMALLGKQLYLGQGRDGTWGYGVPAPGEDDFHKLAKDMKHPHLNRKPQLRDCRISSQLNEILAEQRSKESQDLKGDVSNTQFGLMGLWVARRYGFAISEPLEKAAQTFRKRQKPNGGWTYADGGETNLGMTSAGLMALAMYHVDRKDGSLKAAYEDPAVVAGLEFLHKGWFAPDNYWNGHTIYFYYHLLSLERAMTFMELKKLGAVDWYGGGAKAILQKQALDGSFSGEFKDADTAMALLFLRRANIAVDRPDRVVPPVVPNVPPPIPLDLPLIIPKKK